MQKNMILDNIKNAPIYHGVHKRLKQAFDFLETIDIGKLSEGTFEVDGNNIKAIIGTNKLKSKDDALLEAHQKYIDIHIPLSGNETFGWKSIKTIEKSTDKYDSENDIEFFNDSPATYFTVSPGDFVIFLSEDAHAPLIGSGTLNKIIFKISID